MRYILIGILLTGCTTPKKAEPKPLDPLMSKATSIDAVYAQPAVYVQWQGETWEVMGRGLQNGYVILHLGYRDATGFLQKQHYISEYSLLHQ